MKRATWNPWTELGAHPEVDLVFAPCPVPGLYFPDDATIVVAPGQSRAMRRSVIAEELAHHALSHRPHADPAETARLELRARRWAASRLISIEQLSVVVARARSWPEAAEELEVDEQLVRLRVAELTRNELRELRRAVGRAELRL